MVTIFLLDLSILDIISSLTKHFSLPPSSPFTHEPFPSCNIPIRVVELQHNFAWNSFNIDFIITIKLLGLDFFSCITSKKLITVYVHVCVCLLDFFIYLLLNQPPTFPMNLNLSKNIQTTYSLLILCWKLLFQHLWTFSSPQLMSSTPGV